MWLDQFEFAGFYVAKEKAYYKNVGLDVELKKYDINIDVAKEVLEGRATFGTSSSSLITDKSIGKDIVLLGTVFQSSPLILLALKDANIKNIQDIKGKTLMLTKEQKRFATLQSMLASKNVNLEDINIINHSFNVDDLINKKTDLMLAYTTNEPYILKEKGYESKIFHPKDYGFDFYEEIIFSSKKFVNKNPNIVNNFYKATIKGWEYAFTHIDEVAKLVYEKYNPQNKSLESLIFEANEMKKLVYDKNGKIGTISEDRINLIINTYRVMGLIDNEIELNELIYKNHLKNTIYFDKKEKEYIKNKKYISMCVDPNWLPYEKIYKGKHIGIAADYMNLIEEKLNIRMRLIPTKNWSESLAYVKDRRCDILSLAMTTPSREKYLDFTKPYIKTPIVIASNIEAPFIDNISQLKNKKIVYIKDYAYAQILKIKYPNINFIEVDDITKGLKLVNEGKAFGFIETLASVAYEIQKNFVGQLKIAGKLDESLILSIAVRNDEPILKDIFNKAIDDILEIEKQNILNKWISISYQKTNDYRDFIKLFIILIIIFILLVLIYRQYLLKRLNIELNKKVSEEIKKNEEKNRILIQQSRMASMGEMLENIAHQWRQPLSNISVSASGLQIKKELEILNDKDFEDGINHILKSTKYLSNTIDDFRNFFSKDKKYSLVNSKKLMQKVLDLIGINHLEKEIIINTNIEEIEFNTLKNELIQVLMNIFANAKDALNISFKGEQKYIFVDIYKKENSVIIEIKDNAGGIDDEIIDRVFEPYFTTKHQYKGTGIGLYMSKLLIEKNLDGIISVENAEYKFLEKTYTGAKFKVILPFI